MFRQRFVRVFIFLSFGCCLSVGCQTSESATVQNVRQNQQGTSKASKRGESSGPSRIIFMIGDGMGVPAITGGSYANGTPLPMLSMPELGFMTTHSYEYVTTDSAASATALASGDKTHFQGVSVKPGATSEQETKPSFQLKTLAEHAEQRGWRTGLVATSRIVHATPAAFGAHRSDRHSYEAIAKDFTQSGIDLFFGAGSQYFKDREDGRNLLKKLRKRGYTVTTSAEKTREAVKESDKLAAFLHSKDMPALTDQKPRKMSLPEMTENAIANLDRTSSKGFFLMVEGSQIDWEEHNMSGHGTIKETVDFGRAVQKALDYAKDRQDTLVVVTADHGTGGLAITSPDVSDNYIDALGGESQAKKKVDPPSVEAKDYYDLEPVESFRLGTTQPASKKAPKADYQFGPHRASDKRFSTAFGYFSLASYAHRQKGKYFYSSHTPDLIPIFADGPGDEFVSGASDNAELGKRLESLLDNSGAPMKPEPKQSEDSDAENVVFIVAEGLGLPAVTAGEYAEGPLTIRQLQTRGLASVHSLDHLISDESASASALSTGTKTFNGVLSMAEKGAKLESVSTMLELAEKNDKSTALITTRRLDHAIPTSFFAHSPDCSKSLGCSKSTSIPTQFLNVGSRIASADGFEVTVSFGDSVFSKDQKSSLRAQQYAIKNTWSGGTLKRYDKSIQFVSSPSLPRVAESTLNRLDERKNGFVATIHTHRLAIPQQRVKTDYSLMERMLQFDQLVEEVVEFARQRGNTSVVIVSPTNYTTSVQDTHYAFSKDMCGIAKRCGGPEKVSSYPLTANSLENDEGFSASQLQGEFSPPEIFLQYSWIVQEVGKPVDGTPPKAATFVPLWAMGPETERFEGFQHLSEVGDKIKQIIRTK